MKCDTCGKPVEIGQEYATFYRAGSQRGPMGSFEVLAAHKLCGARPMGFTIGWISDMRAEVSDWPQTWKAIYDLGKQDAGRPE